MPDKEHHMQCALTSRYHLSKMCCTCVLRGAFDNSTHPCSDQKHQFDPAGQSKHILNSDTTCVKVLACSLQSCHCYNKGVQGGLLVTRLTLLSHQSCICMAFSKYSSGTVDFKSIALLRLACKQRSRLVFSVQAGAAVPDKQPINPAANIPTPKHAHVGARKAVPAFPSPSAKGIVSGVKATPANASTPGKGAPSVAQAFPANPAAGSSQVIHFVLQLLLCNALHGGNCTAEIVRYLIPVLYQCALPMCWT